MRKPNLFIIGAMKSGTTTLHAVLDRHPDIFMCPIKEPHYFCERETLMREWPGMASNRFLDSEDGYLSLFAAAGAAPILGEASPGYSRIPLYEGVPERIHRFNPDARFIYVLRDPVQRTISHYWHVYGNGKERRPLAEAVRDPYYTDASDYARQLRPYLDLFGAGRVHVLTLEAYEADRPRTIAGIVSWLGLDPDKLPVGGDLVLNRGRQSGRIRHPIVRHIQRTRLWREVKTAIPGGVKRAGIRLLSRQAFDRRPIDPAPAIAYLRPLQQAQTEALTALLGRPFPEWNLLYAEPDPAASPTGL